MTVTLTPGATTATTAVINLAGYGPDGTVDLQLSNRSDFSFCVCPVLSVPRAASATLVGLNQDATLFARARTRAASGAVERWGPTIGFRTAASGTRSTAPAPIMVEPATLMFPVPIVSANSVNTIAGFPADNLGIPAPVAWRASGSDGSGQQLVRVQITTAGEPVDTLALLNTNMPEAGYVTIEAGDSFSALTFVVGNTPFRASPNLPGRPGYHGLFRFASRANRCWQITLAVPAGAGPPGGIFHVEHLVLGRNLASRNANGDKAETPIGLTTTERTRTGILDRVPGLPMRRAEFDLTNLTEQDFELLYGQLWRRQGDTAFCIPNSKANAFLHDRMLLGTFGAGKISGVQGVRFTRSMQIDSII